MVSAHLRVEPELVPCSQKRECERATRAIACGRENSGADELSHFVGGARAMTILNLAVVQPVVVTDHEV